MRRLYLFLFTSVLLFTLSLSKGSSTLTPVSAQSCNTYPCLSNANCCAGYGCNTGTGVCYQLPTPTPTYSCRSPKTCLPLSEPCYLRDTTGLTCKSGWFCCSQINPPTSPTATPTPNPYTCYAQGHTCVPTAYTCTPATVYSGSCPSGNKCVAETAACVTPTPVTNQYIPSGELFDPGVPSTDCYASGWACDRDFPSRSLDVKLYRGTQLLQTVTASDFRSGLDAACAGTFNHGFTTRLSLPAGSYDISASALDISSSGSQTGTSTQLPNSLTRGNTLTVICPAATPTPSCCSGPGTCSGKAFDSCQSDTSCIWTCPTPTPKCYPGYASCSLLTPPRLGSAVCNPACSTTTTSSCCGISNRNAILCKPGSTLCTGSSTNPGSPTLYTCNSVGTGHNSSSATPCPTGYVCNNNFSGCTPQIGPASGTNCVGGSTTCVNGVKKYCLSVGVTGYMLDIPFDKSCPQVTPTPAPPITTHRDCGQVPGFNWWACTQDNPLWGNLVFAGDCKNSNGNLVNSYAATGCGFAASCSILCNLVGQAYCNMADCIKAVPEYNSATCGGTRLSYHTDILKSFSKYFKLVSINFDTISVDPRIGPYISHAKIASMLSNGPVLTFIRPKDKTTGAIGEAHITIILNEDPVSKLFNFADTMYNTYADPQYIERTYDVFYLSAYSIQKP